MSLIPNKAEQEAAEGAEQAVVDQTNIDNEAVRVYNEGINKLKSKISLQVPNTKYAKPDDAETWHYPDNFDDYAFWKEKCYIRVSNYKDAEGAIVEDSKPLDKKAQMAKEAERAKMMQQAAEQDPNQEPPFEIEKISSKMIMIPSQGNAANVSAFVHHSDASHFIRKQILERAQKVWAKDLKEIHINQLLSHCATKQKVLEEKLFEFIDMRLEWGLGQMFEDRNVKIIFNTFLKANDYRVDN